MLTRQTLGTWVEGGKGGREVLEHWAKIQTGREEERAKPQASISGRLAMTKIKVIRASSWS